MNVLAGAKMPKTIQRDFLVAHRYTICDGISVRSPRGLADSRLFILFLKPAPLEACLAYTFFNIGQQQGLPFSDFAGILHF